MLTEFPIIQTNIWDTVWAIPTVIFFTMIIKKGFKLKSVYVPTVATVLGLIISIFFSHRNDLSAGIFMGFLYGGAAIGTISSIKTSIRAYRAKA